MLTKGAAANVIPVRQRTQYTCMSCSMLMCLKANGVPDLDEDVVNKVMGAQPMRGASWENALACAQHFGMRATLTMPTTVRQLKDWTDRGIPVMIAWNPEGRDWSHASVVFDVEDDLTVHVADPNIPDPNETVRVVPKDEFYKKWYEKWPSYLVRRPAMAIEREITQDGKQVVASSKNASWRESPFMGKWKEGTSHGKPFFWFQVAHGRYDYFPEDSSGRDPVPKNVISPQSHGRLAKAPVPVQIKKPVKHVVHLPPSVSRDPAARALVNRPGKGPHKNPARDVEHGGKSKYPPDFGKEAVAEDIVRQIEAGWQDTLKGLWKTYKEKHPKSEKPPQSLIDEAKAGGKEKGKKDEGGGKGGKPKVRRVGPVTQVDESFVDRLKTKFKGKVKEVGKRLEIDLDGDVVSFKPINEGWFTMSFTRDDEVMGKLWSLYDSLGGVERVPARIGSDEELIQKVASRYLAGHE